MSVFKYLVTLAFTLLAVAAIAFAVVSWISFAGITSTHIVLVFVGYWLLGLVSVGIMKAMGTDTPEKLMRFIMVSKAVRILVSLFGLIGFTLFQGSSAVLPLAILVFVGYLTSLLVESWYYLRLK